MVSFSQDGLPVEIVRAGAVSSAGVTTLSPSVTSKVTVYQFTAWATTGTGTIVLYDGDSAIITAALTSGTPVVYNWPQGLDMVGLRIQGTVNPGNIKYSVKARSTVQ